MANKVAEQNLQWTATNSIPYLIGAALPTGLLVGQFITGLQWTIVFCLLLVGIGMVDVESMKIAGGSMIDFDNEEDEQ